MHALIYHHKYYNPIFFRILVQAVQKYLSKYQIHNYSNYFIFNAKQNIHHNPYLGYILALYPGQQHYHIAHCIVNVFL